MGFGNRGGGGFRAALEQKKLQDQLKAQKAATAEQQRLFEEQKKLRQTEMERGKGYIGQEQNKYEQKAGVSVPGFEGFRDRETGELLSQFKFDPYASDMTRQLRDEATSQGPSRWAQSALQQQQYQQAQGLGRAQLEQQKAQSSAQSQLMRQGGLGGGARTSLARSGMRDALMAAQGVRAQGAERRFDITDADLRRKQELTGTLADVERQGQLQNIGMLEKDVGRRSEFDKTRYTEQMKAWGAEQQAAAQRAAGAQKSGKCFADWNMVLMDDNSLKRISDIHLGDRVFGGGEVLEVRSYSDKESGFQLYDYLGADLTGSHAVYEDGKWVRVRDSKYGIKVNRIVETVLTLVTENHKIVVENCVFSDDMETDRDYRNEKRSLNDLNGELF